MFGRQHAKPETATVATSAPLAPVPVARTYSVVVYADEVLVQGRVTVPTSRLTDLIAMTSVVTLCEADATVLSDGRVVKVPEVEIPRGELIALSMVGPRGDPTARTLVSDVRRLNLRAGPYRISGHAHVPPLLDAVAFARRRGPILPLTEVAIEYRLNEATVKSELAGLIVNLDRIDEIEEVDLQPIAPDAQTFELPPAIGALAEAI